ncbi:MAG: radical SAM protein [Candidatus Heimdallarchaeaceae archaeon]
MRRIKKWHDNKLIGKIPKGCQLCAKGAKMVLFVSGVCDSNCFYCPVAKERRKDVIYADEQAITSVEEAIAEARMISALGMGITGGEPALSFDRVIMFLNSFKKEFGEKFHCHLYTSHALSKEQLKKLFSNGLDEIRFHPPQLQLTKEIRDSIIEAKKLAWSVGIEIPSLPGKNAKIKEIIDFALNSHLDFVNLNELELTESNLEVLNDFGYKAKQSISAAVEGSEKLAEQLLHDYKNTSINLHYCSSRYKDKTQLKNRFLRRAKNYAKKFDQITSEGLIVRGEIVTYNTASLENIVKVLQEEFGIKEQYFGVSKSSNIIYVHWKVAKLLGQELTQIYQEKIKRISIIHQYPYDDGIVTYLEPIYEN